MKSVYIISAIALSTFMSLSSCTNPDTNVVSIEENQQAQYDILGKWECKDVKGEIDLSIPIPGITDRIMVAIQDEVIGTLITYNADSTFTIASKKTNASGKYELKGNALKHTNLSNNNKILSNSNIKVEGNRLTIAVSPEQIWEIVEKHSQGLVEQAKSIVEFSTFNFIFEKQA